MAGLIVCVLCTRLTGLAAAEDFKLNTDYETIIEYYQSAVTAQEDNDITEAIDYLKELVRYYKEQANPGIAKHKDSPLYYAYAEGRVELSSADPDYAFAREQLDKSKDDLYMVTSYRQYAKGMLEMKNGDYALAIADLRAVRSVLTEFTSRCIEALDKCEKDYKDYVMNKGRAACQNENHEKALEMYNQYLELFDSDTDIRRLRDECQDTHGENPEIVDEIGLSIINAVASAQCSMKLTWKGTKDKYTVSWTSDLVQGSNAKSVEVNGKTYTVTDLLPGTVYRFTIQYLNASVQIARETRKAADYPSDSGEERFWTGSSSLFRFDNARYIFLDSGKASYEFANEKSCKYLKNRNVELFEKPISESMILFIFPTFGIPEDLEGKDYQLLLHIDGTATLTEEGVFGKADEEGVVKVCAEDSYIYVLVYDLFDQAVETYSDLSEKTFRLDLLADGKLVGAADGILQ